MERHSRSTNQRIQFDIDPMNRYLATGGEDGRVRYFDLRDGRMVADFRAGSDTINGCMFHPGGPFLATASGHRRHESRGGGDPSDSDSEGEAAALQGQLYNALRIWRLSYAEAAAEAMHMGGDQDQTLSTVATS